MRQSAHRPSAWGLRPDDRADRGGATTVRLGEGGACVEGAHAPGAVPVRDSEEPAAEEWTAFIHFVAHTTGTRVE
ncbi:DUF397 domain-containing protein [Actinacidiphila sp. bgisy167]|uniref:DUF397 domain-containing protein n=1 Tax=Actinacidiphila sp. bgisy167 TaxID=3413797 RepID=UPI003D71D6F2